MPLHSQLFHAPCVMIVCRMLIVRRCLPFHPRAGVNSPELIGQLVEVLPHVPMDVDFPYSCSPGLLGSSSGSTTALCNGLVRP